MAKVYGPATPRGMQRIVDVVRHVERSPGYSLNPGPRNSGSSSELWLPFENNTGSTVPGNSLLRVTGLTLSEGVPILAIAKASTTFGREWAVTANRDVPSGEFGVATLANVPVRLAYDSTQSPAAGETYGPKPDSFVSWENYPGFICLGIVDSTNHIMLATREEITKVRVILQEPLAQDGTADAILFYDNSITVSVNDWLLGDDDDPIPAGVRGWAEFAENGQLYFGTSACSVRSGEEP